MTKTKAKNDEFIEKFLELDGTVYDVREDGTIWTKQHRNGVVDLSNDWRRLDNLKKDKYTNR